MSNDKVKPLYDSYMEITYGTQFPMASVQRIISNLRITSGEKQKMFKKRTGNTEGFDTGIFCESMFAGMAKVDHPESKMFYAEDYFGHWQADADFVYEHEGKKLRLDVKGSKYKKGKNWEGEECPRSNWLVYIPKYIRDKRLGLDPKIEYNTDYYVFMGRHENLKTGFLYGIVDSLEYLKAARWHPAMKLGTMDMPESYVLEYHELQELDRTKELGLELDFSFADDSFESSYYIVPANVPYELEMRQNEMQCWQEPRVTTMENKFFADNFVATHTGNGNYTITFKKEMNESKSYYLHVDRKYVTFGSDNY